MNPVIWLVAQRLLGSSKTKQKLARRYFHGGSILEIGCSVGNVAEAFPDATRYLGHDVDEDHIAYARKRVPHAAFTTEPLSTIQESFDLILVAGVLHHVDDATAIDILTNAKRLAAPQATIMSYDPIPVEPGTPLVRTLIDKLEQGQWLRRPAQLAPLFAAAGLAVKSSAIEPIHSDVMPTVVLADFAVLVAQA